MSSTRLIESNTTPDREENYPDDERFFEAIVSAIALGPIVVIGHGKGQSNEADHLRVYLNKHHKAVAARVVSGDRR